MSNLRSQKRIASEVLGIGKTRVWINPGAAEEVSQAMTRDDVREAVNQGLIQEKPKKVQTREGAKRRLALKKKRKGVGQGKRKGGSGSRQSKKERWMSRVRAQRKLLKSLRDGEKIDAHTYRVYYLRAKGGNYSSLKNLKESMKTDGAL